MKKEHYTKEILLDVMGSYLRQIERGGAEYPVVVLNDIKKSINHVLKINDYNGRYKNSMEG
jgi:hypothetical protein